MFRGTILLVSVSLVISTDLFEEHLQKYMDYNVNPCNNFYRYVCSSKMPENENIMKKAGKLESMWSLLGEQITKERYPLTAFEKSMKELASNEVLLRQLEPKPDQSVYYGPLPNSLPFFVQLSKYKDFLAYREDKTKKHYELIDKLFYTMTWEIERARYPGGYQANLERAVSNLLMEFGRNDTILWEEIEEVFVEANEIWTADPELMSLPLKDITHIGKTLETAFNKESPLSKLISDFRHGRIMSGLGVLQTGDTANHVHAMKTMWMATSEASDSALFAALGNVLAHEIFHIFHSPTYSQSKYVTSLKTCAECTAKHFHGVCEEYKEKGSCYPRNTTFGEDNSDVESHQLGYNTFAQTMRGQMQGTFGNSNLTNAQSYFVLSAMAHCHPEGAADQFESDELSAPYTRVNAPFSLMYAFHDAFHCRKGDKMFDIGMGKDECVSFSIPV